MGGYPESVAKRIATGDLPMDEASRVARREARTHPETYYNGSKSGGILEIDPKMSGAEHGMSAETGFWGGGPERASGYAGNPVHDNSTVYPFRIMDNSDQMIVDGQGAAWNNMKPSSPVSVKHWGEGPTDYGSISGWTDDYWDTNSIAHMAKDKLDFNSVVFKGIADSADEGSIFPELMDMFPELRKMPYGSEQRRDFIRNISKKDSDEAYRRKEAKANSTGTSVVVFDPDDIRSPNAAFDPQYMGSNIMGNADPRLLGGMAIGMTTAGLVAPEIAQKFPMPEGGNRAGWLESVNNWADETQNSLRHATGGASDYFFPESVVDYLKTVNKEDEEPTWSDRLWAGLDLFRVPGK